MNWPNAAEKLPHEIILGRPDPIAVGTRRQRRRNARVADLGVKTMITELDVDELPARAIPQNADVSLRLAADPKLNPHPNGLPASVSEQLAQRYADLFAVYLKHTGTLKRVIFWGVTDGHSWLNNWPIPGRTAYPLLFDRQGQPKECYRRVIDSVRK
jgi:endo-1,4-beta-xylanase